MCVQRRHKSACESAQSDQSPRCPHKESLHPWLSKMCQVQSLIRLRECAESDQIARNAQVDLNLRWAHISKGTFSAVGARLYNVSLPAYCIISLYLNHYTAYVLITLPLSSDNISNTEFEYLQAINFLLAHKGT